MSNPFEFELPTPPELAGGTSVYLTQVKRSLVKAIAEQQAGLIFSRRNLLAEHLEVTPAEAGAVRSQLLQLGYLTRMGNEYFTGRPGSEPSELTLPPGRSLDAVTVAEHLLHVQTALAAAISEQPEGLVFPSLERVSGRFGLNRLVAWALRSTLAQSGYLAQLGHVYVTAHPKRGNETEHTGGENS